MIENAFGLNETAQDSQRSYKEQPAGCLNKENLAKFENTTALDTLTSGQKMMTNKLVNDYNQDGYFDIIDQVWKNRNLHEHFNSKKKAIDSYFKKLE